MTFNNLKDLKEEFLKEAHGAPKLFRDLAKVERYIAESYQTRALIELIQNADDAGATFFGLHEFREGFVVGNNGRPFTTADVEALCRSGASNKQRGGTTIGYRGIGFKSVANLARTVHVISGDFEFCFDRGVTQQVLNSADDVPLIRIPHAFDEDDDRLRRDVKDLMSKSLFRTVFVFSDLTRHVPLEDFSGFDRSSLIFLNNLQAVRIDFDGIERYITVERDTLGYRSTVTVSEGESLDVWEVSVSEEDPACRIAFKKLADTIVPALPHESVIHSFTPTKEFAGANLKINGDYTTDPSRKTIYMDELSQRSFDSAISMLTDSVVSILGGDLARKGFFSPFVDVPLSQTSQFRSTLYKSMQSHLAVKYIPAQASVPRSFLSLRLRPDWLNHEDYESLCQQGLIPIKKDLTVHYPQLPSFLGSNGIRVMSIEEILDRVNSSRITVIGSAQIFAKIVNQYRFDLDSRKLARLHELLLFPVAGRFVQARQVKSTSDLMPEFLRFVRDNADLSDTNTVLRKLGVGVEPSGISMGTSGQVSSRDNPTAVTRSGVSDAFKARPALKKWRSAEQNAAEYLRSLMITLSVADVSQANLGYDLEVMLISGKRVYVEVKSVAHFYEPVKMTNNEYASAHQVGADYYLALVVNDEPFSIRLVANPVNTLVFEKKCERWSWYCDDYVTTLQDVDNAFS